MQTNYPTTVWSRLAVGVVACAALALAVCGGGDEGDGTPATSEATGDAAGAVSTSDLQGCLEAAGFTVNEGSTPDELAESLGITGQFALGGPDDGVGYVTVYGSTSVAEEAFNEEQAAEGDGVVIGRVDTAVYTYSGSGDSAAAIGECLQ